MAEKSKQRILAAPSIIKLAKVHGIDLSKVKGSGKKGFIKKVDIEKLIPADAKTSAKKSSKKKAAVSDLAYKRK